MSLCYDDVRSQPSGSQKYHEEYICCPGHCNYHGVGQDRRETRSAMPAIPAVSYPGVYIQEVPGGVHTIIGVSTSITAFIGRTLRGPVNEPVIVTSYADFERTFGGTWSQSQLPDAVRDFYMNGGNQAIIVRLYHSSGTEALPQIAPLPAVT